MVAAMIRQAIRENRRSSLLGYLASACQKYLHAYYNEGFYDFDRNGEAFALKTAAAFLGTRSVTIWDVGGHEGEWALAAQRIFPGAAIHSFEILPQIAERATHRLAGFSTVTVHALGLSETPGEQTVHWNDTHDTTNAISPRLALFGSEVSEVTCQCTTCDLMVERIPAPTILKIDVEGHEVSVLRGARALLRGPAPPLMVQVEYGDTYLPSGSSLGDIYDTLGSANYQIGRLFPNHVDFKDYDYRDENFRMGNMIAVRDPDLKKRLS